jgi:GTP pyrophosphokinase
MKTTALEPAAKSSAIAAAQQAAQALAHDSPAAGAALARGLAVAELVMALDAEDEVVIGALLHPLLEAGLVSAEAAAAQFGAGPAAFAHEIGRLGTFKVSAQWTPDHQLSAGQAESLRKMLLAVVTDPRLVLVRLAEQLHLMRSVRDLPADERRRLARETREVYAPLANRLGIWQLKWELEDLAFRWLQEDDYKRIASHLNERRADRELYIERITAELRTELEAAGIHAEVAGRPKHIYSIWKKMQRKGLPFDQVFDVRAVRVLTDSVADCYAALGVVHGRWPYIPGEFDDYIATPKENRYRSLHTAVTGPGGVPVEVQIRTREMHDHAELGVAAHWRYKEGGGRDAAYDRKVQWLRQLLAPAGDGEADHDFLDRVRADLFEDRIYALSPKGEVVDLPTGATPIDYAYHVHTDLGHRVRGARVNGRMVTLDHRLQNGEVVEIITGKQPRPSRDWLVESLGFLASPRSRSKVRTWFKKQDEGQNRQEGRELLEHELHRLGVLGSVPIATLLTDLELPDTAALYLALGAGDITIAQVTGAIQRRLKAQQPPPAPATRRAAPRGPKAAKGLTIEGIGDLLSTYARYCGPVPPERIVGYVTLGRGVTIHREGCANFERMAARQPDRVLRVDWGMAGEQRFPVDIAVHAWDRRGLVRDVSAVLADEKISIERMNTVTNQAENTADLQLRVSVQGLEELSRLLTRIQGLPNVISTRRKT